MENFEPAFLRLKVLPGIVAFLAALPEDHENFSRKNREFRAWLKEYA